MQNTSVVSKADAILTNAQAIAKHSTWDYNSKPDKMMIFVQHD